MRAGVTRQAAGQLLREIERCGYVERRHSPARRAGDDCCSRRAGRRLLATVLELVEEIEGDFARGLPPGEFERVRAGLLQIADRIDPGGALGVGDQS